MVHGSVQPREGWRPTKWTITNGVDQRETDAAWQRISVVDGSPQGFFARPDIPPGGRAEWTFIAFPLEYGEWVSAVEYADEWGNTYRREFSKPEPGEHNYVDCGDPQQGSC